MESERLLITEEWLLKNGYSNQGDDLYVRDFHEFGVLMYDGDEYLYYAFYGQAFNKSQWLCKIQYVDQLERLNRVLKEFSA